MQIDDYYLVANEMECAFPPQMSKEALVGLDAGLVLLSLGGNRLEELPDLRPLKGLEVVNLQGNPLRCGCPLLPLRRWVLHHLTPHIEEEQRGW